MLLTEWYAYNFILFFKIQCQCMANGRSAANTLLKLKCGQYPAIHTNYITLYPKAPLYNVIIIVDTVLRQK